MFLIFGISSKEENIEFTKTIVCPNCGGYGRLEFFKTYTYFSLFFIPIFKWNKKYYIRSTCCESLYEMDEELGKDVERGDTRRVDISQLKPIRVNRVDRRICSNCNYTIEDSNFQFCPKCGEKI